MGGGVISEFSLSFRAWSGLVPFRKALPRCVVCVCYFYALPRPCGAHPLIPVKLAELGSRLVRRSKRRPPGGGGGEGLEEGE